MKTEFVVTECGFVEASIEDDRAIFIHALSDSLGTRPPRGAPQDGPSTYWIDTAANQLRARLMDHQTHPFASGNVTYMQLVDGEVEIRYDYDPADSPYVDRVNPAELLALLDAWRARVIELSPEATTRVPPPRDAIPLPPAE